MNVIGLKSLILSLSLILVAGGALADRKQELLDLLTTEGFETITISRTWLGRTRIVAERPDTVREIIFHPRTGEILRDYSETLSSAPDRPQDADAEPDARGRPAGPSGSVPPEDPAGVPPPPRDGERGPPPRGPNGPPDGPQGQRNP